MTAKTGIANLPWVHGVLQAVHGVALPPIDGSRYQHRFAREGAG